MKSRQELSVEIAGVGSYAPRKVLTNHDFEQMVDTSDEWIVQRTGIRERHIASEDQATSDLAVPAARVALGRAQIEPAELDAIVVGTCTPDYLFPSVACLVQKRLGATEAMAYDLEAACSGFLYAMSQGAAMVGTGLAKNVLVIGADALSRFTDYKDRRTCILFGDGAGAVVLRPSRCGGQWLYCELGADGGHTDMLSLPAGGSRRPA